MFKRPQYLIKELIKGVHKEKCALLYSILPTDENVLLLAGHLEHDVIYNGLRGIFQARGPVCFMFVHKVNQPSKWITGYYSTNGWVCGCGGRWGCHKKYFTVCIINTNYINCIDHYVLTYSLWEWSVQSIIGAWRLA